MGAVSLLEAVSQWKVYAEVELTMLERSEFQTIRAAMLKPRQAKVSASSLCPFLMVVQ